MSYVIDTLNKLEKFFGEVTPLPDDIADVIEMREFSGREFLEYLKDEWTKAKELGEEDREVCKKYLGELVALAKMTFKVKGAANQITLPTVRSFSTTAMRAMRVFEGELTRSMSMSPAAGKMSYAKGEGAGEEPDEGVVLTRLSMDDLMGAFDRLLQKRLEVKNVEDLSKSEPAAEAPEAAATAEPAKVTKDETAEQAETAETSESAETESAQEPEYDPNVSDVVVDDTEDATDQDAWAGL